MFPERQVIGVETKHCAKPCFDAMKHLHKMELTRITQGLISDTLASVTNPLTPSISPFRDACANRLISHIQSGSVNLVPEPGTLLFIGIRLAGVAEQRF